MLGWWGLKARAAAPCEDVGGRKREKICWRVVLALWQLEGGEFGEGGWGGFVCLFLVWM